MNPDLTSGIVRIIRPDGKTAGTGFVVAEGLIATCAHVIGARGGSDPERVQLIFRATGEKRSARVVPELWRPPDAGDVAILRLEGPLPQGVRPLPLGSSLGTANHPFQTFGFPPISPEEGIWGDGHILNETWLQGSRVLQISSPQVTPGFSGAPVFDTVTHRVVGMVTAIARPDEFGRMAETAFITPVETLRLICPELRLSDVQPYLGLASFREQDAGFFFGRKREIERLISSLKSEPRFLAVLGPSGSGKSSAVHAGLIPRLRQGAVPGSDRWDFITARPGDRSLQNLEAAGLEGAPQGLDEAAQAWLAGHADKSRLVIILDQFEELLAVASPQVRQDFLNQLNELLEKDLPLTLMLVMRDDFFSRFAKEAPAELFERVQRGFVHIPAALEEDDLKEIITGPAEKVGLQFEEGLVEVICKDVMETTAVGERAGRSTVLPLLEFALTELWMKRKEGYLTHDAYAAIGGVTGSLTQWADQAYQSLAEEGLGDVARRVLTELVNLGDERQGLPDSRRRRALDDLVKDPKEKDRIHRILGTLANARLVATSFDRQSNQETFEIIHDSLIREWARLRQWLKEDSSFLSWDREMENRAASWEEGKRDEGRLLRGLDLDEAQRWLAQRSGDIGQREQRYIQASVELLEREKSEKERRRKRNMRYLAAFSIVALAISIIAGIGWNQADQKTEEALALYLASQSLQVKASSASDYSRQVLLAVESLRHKETVDGDTALRRSMGLLAPLLAQLDHSRPVYAVAFSPDGTKVLTGGDEYAARIWDVARGIELHELPHNDSVYAVAFSPNGTKVLTGSYDGTARIWDVASGQMLHMLPHEDSVHAVAFSPDGTKALTGSNDSTARIWDAASGQEICKLPYEGEFIDVSFSPNGAKVLMGSNKGMARIWDIAGSQELHKLSHEGKVLAVAFSPNGTIALTGGFDGNARFWNVSTGQELYKLPYGSSIIDVAFSPDGTKVLIGGHDGTTRIWDFVSGQVHTLRHEDAVWAVAFSPDGTKALTCGFERTAHIWDVASGQELHKLPHEDAVLAAAFSPDGSKVLTGSNDRTARIWDVASEQGLHKLTHEGTVYAVAFSSDGTKALTGGFDGMARIWNVASGQELHKLPHEDAVLAAAFSPDGSKVLTGSNDDTARIWDVASGEQQHKLSHEDTVRAVAFSPDGTKVLTGSDDNTARIWDEVSGQELYKLTHEDSVYSVAFSPDGTKVLSGSSSNYRAAHIWDVASGMELHELDHGGIVDDVAFSPDGTKALIGSYNEPARVWDVASGMELHELGDVNAVAFSPDGTKALTGSDDNAARIWDVVSGQELHKLPHEGSVNAVAFSPDGSKVMTGSGDRTARIWDAVSGQELHKLPHDGSVRAVALSPDGTKVLTGSEDGTAWIWPVECQDLIEQACDCIAENLTVAEWERYKISDVRTCPREGRFNHSALTRLMNDPWGFLTGSPECQPCVAEAFCNRK